MQKKNFRNKRPIRSKLQSRGREDWKSGGKEMGHQVRGSHGSGTAALLEVPGEARTARWGWQEGRISDRDFHEAARICGRKWEGCIIGTPRTDAVIDNPGVEGTLWDHRDLGCRHGLTAHLLRSPKQT